MKQIKIIGTGISVPSNKVNARFFDEYNGLKIGTTKKITGLEYRYFLKDQSVDELINSAIKQATDSANIAIDDIDCIVSASATMGQMIPYNGAYIHKLLNPENPIPSFDINMTCLSFLRAFDLVANLFDEYPTILILSCDIASRGLDVSNIQTAGIFSDGVASVIVQKPTNKIDNKIYVSNFQTHSKGFEYCQIRGGGYKLSPKNYSGNYQNICNFEMDGKKLFKLSLDILPKFIHDTLKSVDLTLDDIDYIVPHQASLGSLGSLEHMANALKIDKNKMINIFKEYGNQVLASLPTALHILLNSQKVKAGDKVMLVGTSAGVGLGLMVWGV